MNKIGNKNDKSKKSKNIEEIVNEHDEIKDALETMYRIQTVEDVKARNIIEQSERYFHIR